MIKSFYDKTTETIFAGRRAKGVSDRTAKKARQKLRSLDAATSVEDVRVPPSNHLHALGGERKGQWAINVDQQYRICFAFDGGHAEDVELTDYH